MLLQSVKTFTAAGSQLMPCTSCASASPHSMRKRGKFLGSESEGPGGLESPLGAGQVCTPPGFAPTNNPCETFNRAFKRDYTQKRKLKLAVLLQQMQYCCSHRSMASTEFEPRRTSDKRQSRAQQHFDVADISPSRNSISFLAHDASGNFVCELSTPPLHFYTPSLGRSEEALDVAAQFSANYARMKIDDLPSTGWPVDLEAQHCPCRYHSKMRDCVHPQLPCNTVLMSTKTVNAKC
ncbi:hypothetical protein PC119_g9171 [Phytophthora cactorum]|nr:hypothetical protein PC119_g9171 [Phytophthora cactorum]